MAVKVNRIDSWIYYLRLKVWTLVITEWEEDQEENPVTLDQNNQYSLEDPKLLFWKAFCCLENECIPILNDNFAG